MKRSLFGFLLATLLVLTGFAAAHAQDAQPTPADEPSLRMPRYIAPAYTTLGTRNADGTPGPNYWQNHSVHDIAIEVAPPGRTVTGTQMVTYTNNSPNPLPYRRRPALSECAPAGGDSRRASHTGFPDRRHPDRRIQRQRPGDAVGDLRCILPFETVKLVPLAQPLLPGESATFTFKWHYDLGLEYNREGVFDPTTFFIGYFFPRIATYSDTDAGLLPGWDLEEYTYLSGRELNNDFADFNFSVTVPKNFLVWATGELQNPDEVLQPEAAQRLLESRTSDEIITVASPEDLQQGLITAQTDTVTWRWQAENVPDVAIGLSDHYVWDAGSVVVDPATDRRVSVHAAYAAEFADFEQMAQDIKEIVVFASSEWPGVPWPYSHAIVFVGGGDEEFPMMANDGPEAPEGVSVRFIAAHELLHNYFPFYMGIDERRYPFMDEGWTTAFEYLFNLEDIGQEAADASVYQSPQRQPGQAPYAGEEIPIIMPADATRGMVTGNGTATRRPALAYLALKEYMGDEAFKSSLHAFIDRWHGKRPLPWDMFNTFDDTSDLELNWFFQNWFFESNYLDIALGDVQAVDGGYAIVVENVGGAAIPFDVKVVYADDSEESFRQGPGVWQDSPAATTVTITTDQGTEVRDPRRRHLCGRQRWLTIPGRARRPPQQKQQRLRPRRRPPRNWCNCAPPPGSGSPSPARWSSSTSKRR